MPDMYGSERNDSELIDRFVDRRECDSPSLFRSLFGPMHRARGYCMGMGPEYCILILQ